MLSNDRIIDISSSSVKDDEVEDLECSFIKSDGQLYTGNLLNKRMLLIK